MTDTRQRLLDAALLTLSRRGIAGTSARSIAATAEVNQALVFYHFGSVDRLIDVACREGAAVRAAAYRERFATVTSLRELLLLGRDLHTEESARGHVSVMAQVLAGARTDPRLAAAGRDALASWVAEIEPVLARLLGRSPVAEAVDVPGLARAVAAAFVGLELYDGVDPEATDDALRALEQLAVLVDVVEGLGGTARTALRHRLRRARARSEAVGSRLSP